MAKVILFNKPYGVLSQFTDADGHPGLAGFLPIPNVYPAGRLDQDSEGLLLLTDDGRLQAKISDPRFKLAKTYWVQVEGTPDQEQVERLAHGVILRDGPTRPAAASIISPPDLWPRNPPIRFRKNITTSWLQISIREGRNRQVRRMTAAVGLPTLRLIRVAVGHWRLNDLQPGEYCIDSIHVPKDNPKRRTNPR